MIRNSLASVTLILIAACSSGPPVYKSKATRDCGIAEYNLKWVDQAVEDISWSGACAEGLASGEGVMVVARKDGRRRTFRGRMSEGRFLEGELTLESGHMQRGDFFAGALTRGQFLRPDGTLVFHGEFANNMTDPTGKKIAYEDQRYYSGTIFFSDGGRIEEGRFDISAGIFEGIKSIDPQTGKGIVWGKFYKGGQLLYRMVNGRMFDSDAAYADAVSVYITEEKRASERAQAASLAKERERRASVSSALAETARILSTRQQGGISAQPTTTPTPPPVSSINSTTSTTAGRYTGFVHEVCMSSNNAPGRPGAEFDVGTTFTNRCSEPVHARWCEQVAGGSCDYKGTYGYDLKPGEARTFYRSSKKTTGFLLWACKVSEGGRRIRMDSKPSCIFEN